MDLTQLAIVLIAAALAALIKSITGTGYPLILIPILGWTMNVADAVVLVTLSNLWINLRLAWNVRSAYTQASTVPTFVASAVIGSVLGGFVLAAISETILRLALAVTVVVFLVWRWRAPTFQVDQRRAISLSYPVGLAAGLSQGATGISGLIVTPWFMSLGRSREVFIFSMTAVYALGGIGQLFGIVLNDLMTRELLLLGLAPIPLVTLTSPIGVRIRDSLDTQKFDRAVMLILACSALSLVAQLL